MKLKKIQSLGILFITLFSLSSWANDFNQRFRVMQNSQGETIIKDRIIFDDVSVRNYVSHLANFFREENLNRVVEQIENKHFLADQCRGADYDLKHPRAYRYLLKVVDFIRSFNFGRMINDPAFRNILHELDEEGKALARKEQWTTLANLDNSKYFFTMRLERAITDRLRDLVRDTLDVGGWVNFAFYIIRDFKAYIWQKRAYNQNILLQYLEEYEPEALGLTEEQVAHAKSSIYESRIRTGRWFYKGFRESRRAQRDWDEYGEKKQRKARRSADRRWRKFSDLFRRDEERINSRFMLADYRGSDIIINLAKRKSRFYKQPSFVYDPDCPNFNYDKRFAYELIGIGLKLAPIPFSSRIRDIFEKHYKSQIPLEGFLFATANKNGREDLTQILMRQSLNPFITF